MEVNEKCRIFRMNEIGGVHSLSTMDNKKCRRPCKCINGQQIIKSIVSKTMSATETCTGGGYTLNMNNLLQ